MNSYTDPTQHLFWLASRSLGIVAVVLLAVTVGLGLGLSTRILKRPGLPARLKHLHEAISLTALAAIAGHGLLLLGDPYLRPGLAGIALPFAMPNQPVWTGVGIIGGWLAAVTGLSFYARRWIGAANWRRLHRWTIAAYVLSVGHALGSGSDARAGWMLLILGATAAPVVFLLAYRFLPSASPPAAARASGLRSQA
jgi:sulfoxide reductase heme-binding subunit YedZ